MTPNAPRYDWTRDQIGKIYHTPLLDLIHRAGVVHRQFHDSDEVQVCKLISIKTGGCPEDCNYCSQSVRYQTEVDATPLMDGRKCWRSPRRAKAAGVTRVCIGAAWRQVEDNSQFDRVLDMVRDVTDLGVEVCCTLGMLNPSRPGDSKRRGCTPTTTTSIPPTNTTMTIITTRTYADRLNTTLANVRKTNVTVCSGGIIGLGETDEDRISMLQTLATHRRRIRRVGADQRAVARCPARRWKMPAMCASGTRSRMIATARIVDAGSRSCVCRRGGPKMAKAIRRSASWPGQIASSPAKPK